MLPITTGSLSGNLSVTTFCVSLVAVAVRAMTDTSSEIKLRSSPILENDAQKSSPFKYSNNYVKIIIYAGTMF